jgi:translocation and assembly module TamA
MGKKLVLAGRARVGSIVGAARDDIAPSRRLYSGGGGSVRGFGYQQLGPKDVDNNPIGGRSLTEFAVEARYRFGNYGIVPFFDGGRVGESSTPEHKGHALRRRHRRALLYQFRPVQARCGDAARPQEG